MSDSCNSEQVDTVSANMKSPAMPNSLGYIGASGRKVSNPNSLHTQEFEMIEGSFEEDLHKRQSGKLLNIQAANLAQRRKISAENQVTSYRMDTEEDRSKRDFQILRQPTIPSLSNYHNAV